MNFLILSSNGQTMERVIPNQAEKYIELQVGHLAKGSYLLEVTTSTGTRKVIRALKQ